MAQFCSAHCRPTSVPKKKTWFWIVTAYCIVVAFLLVVSSIADYVTEGTEERKYDHIRSHPAMKALLTFSAYTNGAEILSTKKRSGQIHSLNCIRTASMTWVMVCHVFTIYQNGDNPLGVLNSRYYFLNHAFLNGFVSVDSFLFIGGVLLGYLFFKEMKRNRRSLTSPIYWSLYYIHRYLRLSAPYFFFIGFFTIYYPYLSKGPTPDSADGLSQTDTCRSYWWRNVLYINNYFDINKNCMGHTWYLATDMQIHYFAPLLLVSLFLSPIAGGIVALLLMMLTIGATYGTYYKYKFPATIVGMAMDAGAAATPDMADFFKYIYTAPWIRYTPNLFGVLTGYILYRFSNRRLHFHWLIVLASWIASAACAVACVYGLFDYIRGESTLTTFASASYYTFHRVGWSLSLAWVVIACQFNMAGPIKNFMEHGFWMPLGRLTYCAYLTHFMVIYVLFAQERSAVHFTNITYAYIHGGLPVFVVSYAFSFVWSCGFELPFGKLEKMAVAALVGQGRKSELRNGGDVVQKQQQQNGIMPRGYDAWQTDEPVRFNATNRLPDYSQSNGNNYSQYNNGYAQAPAYTEHSLYNNSRPMSPQDGRF